MDEDQKPKPVLRYRLTVTIAEKRIRTLAANSANIDWGDHALERMELREIPDVDVLRVLRTGYADGQPEETQVGGEWKVKMVKKIRGDREVGVVTVILVNSRLFVKTVEWEDLP